MTEEFFREFIRKHQLAVEALTETQLAEAIRQAIFSGDFMRNVVVGLPATSHSQSVVYVPYRELDRLRSLYNELLYAVERKHDGETRHETALRYIQEAEKALSTPETSDTVQNVCQ